MKRLMFAIILTLPLAGPALADPCDKLISTLESALAAPGASYANRIELDALLNAGRKAKAAGNTQYCEQAMTGSPGQPPQSAPADRDANTCRGTPSTV
jgi:hypothetical protein